MLLCISLIDKPNSYLYQNVLHDLISHYIEFYFACLGGGLHFEHYILGFGKYCNINTIFKDFFK